MRRIECEPVDHIVGGEGSYEVFTPRVRPHAQTGLVRTLSGYLERAEGFSTRVERATADVILIFEVSEPIGMMTREGHRRFFEGGFVAGLDDLPTPTELSPIQAGIEVRLTPRAARRLLGVPLAEVGRRVVGVTELLDGEDRHIPERLHETTDWGRRLSLVSEMLTRRLRVPVAGERRVARAFERLTLGEPVSAAAAFIEVSVTHLERLFAEHFGVPPSVAARLHRLDRLVATLRRDPARRWADLVHELGFADQPHLVREVKRLTGFTPSALRASLGSVAEQHTPRDERDLCGGDADLGGWECSAGLGET